MVLLIIPLCLFFFYLGWKASKIDTIQKTRKILEEMKKKGI